MHVLAVAMVIIFVVFVGGIVAVAWFVRALLYRKARASGWTPPSRGMSGGYYGPDGQFYPVDNGGQHGGHHGGHHGGGFFDGGGGHHGGGHSGGGGGDGGGGGHHH